MYIKQNRFFLVVVIFTKFSKVYIQYSSPSSNILHATLFLINFNSLWRLVIPFGELVQLLNAPSGLLVHN